MSKVFFPAAFMANTFAMMLVMIGLSLFGKSELAADFGIIHGATVALFYSFSGNARSIILSENNTIGCAYLLRIRCFLVLPLCALAFMLSIGLVASGSLMVLLLVTRRACEWLAEIFLCEQEHQHRPEQALRYFLTQGLVSVVVLAALTLETSIGYWVLAIWAVSPLCWCIRPSMFVVAFKKDNSNESRLTLLLPHFGSTAAVGVSVYVFRLFIVLLAGRQVAGDLFSAFAIGGMLGTVFTQVLGPTLIHSQKYSKNSDNLIIRLVSFSVAFSFCVGLLILGGAYLWPEALVRTGKAGVFWYALGCSLMGGAIMVKAQEVRLRLLQLDEGKDVFGSDLLANILLISSIPFLYFSVGISSLVVLYLLSAMLSWIFYFSERGGVVNYNESAPCGKWILQGLVFLLFFPLFFQLSGGVYQGGDYFSSGGKLALLPIPVSVLACYTGIVLLGGYSKARLTLICVFFIFFGMLFTSLLLEKFQGSEIQKKLILLVQYVLPLFALVLGQQFGLRRNSIFYMAKTLFFILSIVVPLEIASTLGKGLVFLSPSVYLFGIYQHLQYVPVIFVGSFIIALFSLGSAGLVYRWGLFLLSFMMGIYVSLSVSILAFSLMMTGTFAYFLRGFIFRESVRYGVLVVSVAFLSMYLGVVLLVDPEFLSKKIGFELMGSNVSLEGLNSRTERWGYWQFYLSGIFEGFTSFWLGHVSAPDRGLTPSAHNYYLDFIYNFGVLPILPLLVLMAFTVHGLVRNFFRVCTSPEVFGVAGVVLFLLFADNMLKVGMRQPYPGIITFFLWGILLSIFIAFRTKDSGTS